MDYLSPAFKADIKVTRPPEISAPILQKAWKRDIIRIFKSFSICAANAFIETSAPAHTIPEIKRSILLAKKFKNVEILWASVREPYNYLQAKQLGCHLITVPPSIIEKIELFGKSFDQLTIETVKAFLTDSKKSKFKI